MVFCYTCKLELILRLKPKLGRGPELWLELKVRPELQVRLGFEVRLKLKIINESGINLS